MSLTAVWLQTLADGLIRADLAGGIHAHPTPALALALAGKPSHWLLDVVLSSTMGSDQPDSWTVSPLHRTLARIADQLSDAPQHLARLLAQLDATLVAGIITTSNSPEPTSPNRTARSDTPRTTVRFRFTPFPAVEAGHQYDREYL